jgi:hypothetical protein
VYVKSGLIWLPKNKNNVKIGICCFTIGHRPFLKCHVCASEELVRVVTFCTHLRSVVKVLSSPLVFSEVRVTRSLVLFVMFSRSLLAIWLLRCLSFDLRILIIPLGYSNSSCIWFATKIGECFCLNVWNGETRC